ncbi:MAG: helix-turn-helix transcriptional regulator [Gammaproteobacteria bacterium]|jgi:DNA-binding Xre family transcriptional regulator
MAQVQAVIATLKQALKEARLTYADVAEWLGMSEANVKRMFASQRFSLERLEAICELMHMDLIDLFQRVDASRRRITQLLEEQERELVADAKLLLVAVSVRNHLSYEEIIRNYKITEAECLHCLATLDRLHIIDLLPRNRIKLRIDENFSWRPNGPIERFFERQVQSQFLKSGFNSPGSLRVFIPGLLSEHSQDAFARKLLALAKEFNELHRQDSNLPLEKRRSIGLLLALREWEFAAFRPFSRHRKN